MDFPAAGRKVGAPRGRWVRGAARIDGGLVVVDEPYVEWTPEIHGDRVGPGDPIVELAAIRDPVGVVEFANRFGLLWHDASCEHRESLQAWDNEAKLLKTIIGLYVDVQTVSAERTPDRLRELRLVWQPLVGGAASDAEFVVDAARVVADVVSKKLADAPGVQERVAVLARPDRVEQFVFESEASTLLALLYHQAAVLMVAYAPMRACTDPRCGRFFTLTDRRQKFCSPQHATRARVRRHREGDQR